LSVDSVRIGLKALEEKRIRNQKAKKSSTTG